MEIKIRSEKTTDYTSIANVTYEAFLGWHPDNQYVSEPVLVDLLRHNSYFNPELSLVAEMDNKIVGHALFSPYKFVVQGSETMGAVLAPIAVLPEYQGKGIGEKLIEEGHYRLKELGYTFSLLCGHDTYYPRFGYKTKMFSESGTILNFNNEKFDCGQYSIRPVFRKDLPWIIKMWYARHKADPLALFPGENISEWNNHGIGARASIILKDNKNIGYIRYNNNNLCVKELLADNEHVCEILKYLAAIKYGKPKGELQTLLSYDCLYPLIKNEENIDICDESAAYTAFMIKVLLKDTLIEDYCEKVENEAVKPGIVVFPPTFDIEDGRVD